MKKILLLGSGELGKEFVISAKRLGCHVVACDSYAGAPAMQVADEHMVFSMLDDAALRQLRQRITVRFHLKSLDHSETELYVHWRMQVAGGNGRPTFSPWALRRIHRYSRGIPRLINAVCDTALLAGYVAGEEHLTGRHVGRAIRELEGRRS